MSASFSRSVRTLQQSGSGNGSFFVALFLAALLVGWLAWFLFLPMAQYETDAPVVLVNSKTAKVILPASALVKLQAGQSVQLELDAFPATEFGMITAVTTPINTTIRDGEIQVNVQILTIPEGVYVQSGLTGTADIQTDTQSPVTFLLSTMEEQLSR